MIARRIHIALALLVFAAFSSQRVEAACLSSGEGPYDNIGAVTVTRCTERGARKPCFSATISTDTTIGGRLSSFPNHAAPLAGTYTMPVDQSRAALPTIVQTLRSANIYELRLETDGHTKDGPWNSISIERCAIWTVVHTTHQQYNASFHVLMKTLDSIERAVFALHWTKKSDQAYPQDIFDTFIW